MVDLQKYLNLKTKAIQVQATCKSKYNSAKNLKVQYDEENVKLDNEKKSAITQSVSIDTLKEIIDKLSQESVRRVADLLTYGLSIIFYDKKYSVEIQTSDQRSNKTAELYLVETLEDGSTIKSSFVDACGGGVLSVCGLILQVYFCNLLHQSPVLFLDEALSQVSAEYTDTLMNFIKELAASKDLIMVLITHDTRYMGCADKTFHVSEGTITEVKING